MPGPLHPPSLLILYPFRYRDALSGKWVRAPISRIGFHISNNGPRSTMTVLPNLAVNTDAPRARLRPRSGSPVTFVR